MTTALIDGDIIVYRCGFQADRTFYMVGGRKFKYKKKARDWVSMHGLDDSAIVKHHEPGDEAEAFKRVDDMIGGILDATGSDQFKVFLSGSTNVRHTLATSIPYKGNRSSASRPHHYGILRDFLVEKYNAVISEPIEADDMMGIHQTDDTIICSIDKDMLTVPGWHYHWDKRTFRQQSVYDADFAFYTQMLIGDRADNITSIFNDTESSRKKAEAMLRHFSTTEEMKCFVGMQYALVFDNPEERMYENAQLLYILRDEDDEWRF